MLDKIYIRYYNVDISYKVVKQTSEVIHMDKEKKEAMERVAEKFTYFDPEMKDKMAWYILGRQEERAKWEKDKQTA